MGVAVNCTWTDWPWCERRHGRQDAGLTPENSKFGIRCGRCGVQHEATCPGAVAYRDHIRALAQSMTQIQTSRVHPTWLDRLLLWQRAYQTKIFDQQREVVGRGRTPEASQEAAERQWLAELADKSK